MATESRMEGDRECKGEEVRSYGREEERKANPTLGTEGRTQRGMERETKKGKQKQSV